MEETVTNKGIIGILLACVMLIGMIAGVYSPTEKAHAAEDYRTWSQKDERWAYTPLGGSTVKESGCYITSIAMVAAASGARDTESFNPGVFAQQLNNIGAFSWDGSLMYWASVNAVIPEVKIETANLYFNSGSRESKASEMKSWLDKGMYVICNVGGHWVYVDGISGADVIMADPAKTETYLYNAYSDILCYQVLSGKNPYGSHNEPATTEAVTTTSSETTTTTTSASTTTTTETSSSTTTTSTTSKETSTTTIATTAPAEVTATAEATTMRAAVITAPFAVLEKSADTRSEETQTTEATTTTAASTEAETTSTTEAETGEYFYSGSETASVYSEMNSESTVITSLRNGDIVSVTRTVGEYGCINISGTDAWVKMSELEYAGESRDLEAGDINGDGEINAVDLALLNEYIRNAADLPEGVSTLRRCEIEAADVSGDGAINSSDVLIFLMLICE